MGREIRQYDIPDRLLRETNAQSSAVLRKDMGEAKITHTIFGKAKVRVIREQDNIRRTRLLTTLLVMALGAAAWQGWIVLQQSELLQSAGSPSSPRETVQVSAPAFQPENIFPSAKPPSVRGTQRTLLQAEIDSLVSSSKSAPRPPLGLKAPGQMAAKPDTSQPVVSVAATLPATRPLANKPVPPVVPLIKENSPILLPASGAQPSGLAKAQP